MTQDLALISVIISGLVLVAVSLLTYHLKFLKDDLRDLRDYVENHISTELLKLSKEIGELKGRLTKNGKG